MRDAESMGLCLVVGSRDLRKGLVDMRAVWVAALLDVPEFDGCV